jgi:hypothetical protein
MTKATATGELHRAETDRACAALHQDAAALDGTGDVHGAMGCDARNSKARALLE